MGCLTAGVVCFYVRDSVRAKGILLEGQGFGVAAWGH